MPRRPALCKPLLHNPPDANLRDMLHALLPLALNLLLVLPKKLRLLSTTRRNRLSKLIELTLRLRQLGLQCVAAGRFLAQTGLAFMGFSI